MAGLPLFHNKLISRFGDVLSPLSPDLSMNYFFLWGFLNTCVYEDKSHTLQELKESIVQGVHWLNTDADLCERVQPVF